MAILAGILEGARITLGVALYGAVYAIPFALVFGTLQYLSRGFLNVLTTIVIEFWRSNATIILLYVFYYIFPLAGFRWSAINVAAAVIGLNIGGYASQVVHAGLLTVPKGQLEAGLALGLSRTKALMLIELPQALRLMVPAFINEAIRLLQTTAIVSLIGLADMTFQAKQIGQSTYQPTEIYTALLLAYFVLSYPLAIAGRRIEARVKASTAR